MAEEEFFGVGDYLDTTSEALDGVFASNRRSGSLNSITNGSPLYYPSDILSSSNPNAQDTNGIISWLEFRMFFKQNGSLNSVVKKVSTGVGRALGQVGGAAAGIVSAAQGEEISSDTEGETAQILLENLAFSDSEVEESLRDQTVTSDTRLGRATEETNDSIFLYVPGGIEYKDSFQYEGKDFAGVKNLSDVSASGGAVALGMLKKLGGAVDKGAGAIGLENLSTGAAIQAEMGIVANPRKEQMFQGVDMRTFAFNFVFIPRNREEATTVANIIKTFRFHAHPELSANSAFFNFPSEFEIKYRVFDKEAEAVKDNPAVPRINRCFLESISTNYTPDDVYYAFKNGMPPKITLSLSFKEAEYITRQHVNEGF